MGIYKGVEKRFFAILCMCTGLLMACKLEGDPVNAASIASWEASVYAGNGYKASVDGVGTAASFYEPNGLAVDNRGNVYVAQFQPQTGASGFLRKIDSDQRVSTIVSATAGGNCTSCWFENPRSVFLDANKREYTGYNDGAKIYVINSDYQGGGIMGVGAGTIFIVRWPSLNKPSSGFIDKTGFLYYSGFSGNYVEVSTNAAAYSSNTYTRPLVSMNGSGPSYLDSPNPVQARLYNPVDLAFGRKGDLFIADMGNHLIRKVAGGTGAVTTFAGFVSGNQTAAGFADGLGTQASFTRPVRLAFDQRDNLYVLQNCGFQTNLCQGSPLRIVSPEGVVTTPAIVQGAELLRFDRGTGSGTSALAGMALDNTLYPPYIYISNGNNQIIKLRASE
jgi:hypothetical protein